MIEVWDLNGHCLEYLDDIHVYLVDGVIVKSVTQILKTKFGGKYDGVSKEVLQRASERGTAVHSAIENYCKHGVETDDKELRNFKFLQNAYKFNVVANEIPVILFMDDVPVCAGRLDMVLEMTETADNGNTTTTKLCLADIKRTATLDKEYLAYQLNIYRLAYQQCYMRQIDGLKGIHLRDDVRKFVDIPIKEEMTWNFINEYVRGVRG